MFGFIRRVIKWTSRSNRHFVGFDLEGNRFYQYPNLNDASRPKRVVKYLVKKPLAEYANSDFPLPVQWKAWLSYQRATPPTLEELRNDQNRLLQLRENVARIQEKDQSERAISAPLVDNSTEASNAPQPVDLHSSAGSAPSQQTATIEAEQNRKRAEMQKSPLTAFQPVDTPSDAPAPWEPQLRRRRGA